MGQCRTTRCVLCPFLCFKTKVFSSSGSRAVRCKSVGNVFAFVVTVDEAVWALSLIQYVSLFPSVIFSVIDEKFMYIFSPLVASTSHPNRPHRLLALLVGVKTIVNSSGNLKFPSWVNKCLDADVIVSGVRETSRKPEVYGMIERMCLGGQKIEISRTRTRPGWLTLGNQLGAGQIYEEDLAARIKAR